MTPLALSQYGMHNRMFSPLAAPFALMQLAGAVAKLSMPLISLYALSNIPIAAGKTPPTITAGPKRDGFVECMNACDKVEAEIIRLLCQTTCAVLDMFKKKEK